MSETGPDIESEATTPEAGVPLPPIWERPGNVAHVMEVVLDEVSDPVIIVDLDGRVLRWSRSAERTYGWTAAEVIGEFIPIVPQELRLHALSELRTVAASDGPVRSMRRPRRKDGIEITVRSIAMPLIDADGAVVAVAVLQREVPHEHRETSLTSRNEASILAEELRGPLAALFGYAQLLQRDEINEDPVRRSRTVAAVEQRAADVMALIDDVVLAARVREGTARLECEPVDLTALVADAITRVRKHTSGARVMVDYRPGLGSVRLDRRLVEGALVRLVEGVVRQGASDLTISITRARSELVVSLRTSRAAEGPGSSGALSCGQQAETNTALQLAAALTEAHGGSLDCKDDELGREYRMVLPIAQR